MKRLAKSLHILLNSDSGRRHPFKIVARFVYLQLRRRLLPGPFVFQTCVGTRAMVEKEGDFTAISGLFYHQIPDLHEVVFAWHALRPGECFLDIGANQGYWCLLLAARGLEVHPCEPTPVTYANLLKQVALQTPEVRELFHPHNVALADQAGSMRYLIGRGQNKQLVAEGEHPDEPSTMVEVTTADALAGDLPVRFIKIDVEGWTAQVLKGSAKILAQPGLIGLAIETFRYADGGNAEIREIEELLGGHGFLPYDYDPATRKLRKLSPGNEGRQDTLYLRVDDELRKRLAEAPAVRCLGDDY